MASIFEVLNQLMDQVHELAVHANQVLGINTVSLLCGAAAFTLGLLLLGHFAVEAIRGR